MVNAARPSCPRGSGLRLEIPYNRTTNIARCRITLVDETIPAAHRASAEVVRSSAINKIVKGKPAVCLVVAAGRCVGDARCQTLDELPAVTTKPG